MRREVNRQSRKTRLVLAATLGTGRRLCLPPSRDEGNTRHGGRPSISEVAHVRTPPSRHADARCLHRLRLVLSFGLGHWTGRWAVHAHYKRFAQETPLEDRMRDFSRHAAENRRYYQEWEYDRLRRAVEEHRERSPTDQRAAIDGCLAVMRQQRERKQHIDELIAEGK